MTVTGKQLLTTLEADGTLTLQIASKTFDDPTGSQVNACAATTDYRPVPPNGDSMPRPHIQVGRPRRRAAPEKKAVDWLMWAVVALIAVGTCLAAMFLLPRFTL